jgi:hypothetical protein
MTVHELSDVSNSFVTEMRRYTNIARVLCPLFTVWNRLERTGEDMIMTYFTVISLPPKELKKTEINPEFSYCSQSYKNITKIS